ncbi:MAG: tetratricopeptide repeat protein [Chloroflexi bacterium]|nr:tetratricopeptide repeat protein [Chloroflexota bacterium]
MNRRRKRPNLFRIALLSLLIAATTYVTGYVIPTQPQFGVPTPTITRSPESFVTEAEGYFAEGKLLPAIEAYKQAIASSPEDPAVYVALARTQVFAGQYKDAQTSAESAILLNNNNSNAHAVRAWALDFQGETLEAEASIKRALELDPNNALAHAYYSEILVDAYYSGTGIINAIEKAIEESKVAIALAPDALETHRARGYVYEATGNYEEAIREYEAAIAVNPNIADLHLALGRNHRILGSYDKAVLAFTRANALNPEDPTPDLFISRTYATIGEYAKAMQYAESAKDNNPADTSLRGNLGVMYYRNAYWTEAITELGYVVDGGVTEDGVRLEPINLIPNDTRTAEYYFTYGLALSRLNECGKALTVARSILERIPADELAVENANAIIARCQQNLDSPPQPTETPLEADSAPTEIPTATEPPATP